MKPVNRDDYLLEATAIIRNWIQTILDAAGFDYNHDVITKAIRINVGYPLSRKKGKVVVAEIHPLRASVSGDTYNVTLNPEVYDMDDVVGHLLHEMLHPYVGFTSKHGPRFRKAAHLVGLTGKPSETVLGPIGVPLSRSIEEGLGHWSEYHTQVQPLLKPEPRASRLYKLSCQLCGFVYYSTKPHLAQAKKVDHHCPKPPLKASEMGGQDEQGEPPVPEPQKGINEVDVTPVEGGAGGSTGEGSGDTQDNSNANAQPGETATCGGCSGPVDPNATSCRHCGALFEEEVNELAKPEGEGESYDSQPQETDNSDNQVNHGGGGDRGVRHGSSVIRPGGAEKLHLKELCPFGAGCPQCAE